MERKGLIQNIQDILALSDRVLFVSHGETEIESLFAAYAKRKAPKKIRFLLDNNVSKQIPANADSIWLNEEDSMKIRKLYFAYEFSDKFSLFSADSNFGTILNYVKTGLLSPDEAASALLD